MEYVKSFLKTISPLTINSFPSKVRSDSPITIPVPVGINKFPSVVVSSLTTNPELSKVTNVSL